MSPFGTPDDGRSGRLAVPAKTPEWADTCATESLVAVSPEVYGELLLRVGVQCRGISMVTACDWLNLLLWCGQGKIGNIQRQPLGMKVSTKQMCMLPGLSCTSMIFAKPYVLCRFQSFPKDVNNVLSVCVVTSDISCGYVAHPRLEVLSMATATSCVLCTITLSGTFTIRHGESLIELTFTRCRTCLREPNVSFVAAIGIGVQANDRGDQLFSTVPDKFDIATYKFSIWTVSCATFPFHCVLCD